MKTQIRKLNNDQIKELAEGTLLEKECFVKQLRACVKMQRNGDRKLMEKHLRTHVKQCDEILEGIILELCKRI